MKNLINASFSRRKDLLQSPDTDTFRLIDGAGDGLPGIYLDQLGAHWLLSTKDASPSDDLKYALAQYPKSIYWKHLDPHQKESPTHLLGDLVEEPFLGEENGLNLELSFQSGYSQGLFLDQRTNRAFVRDLVHPGDLILNTFAYTGAFSVIAATQGAITTTLDLSQPTLEWAKRNMQHNSITSDEQYYCKGNTFHWLKRFAKTGRTFKGIILDPPTFSRDAAGKTFQAHKHFDALIELASQVVQPGGWILASTNCRQLSLRKFNALLAQGLPKSHETKILKMPEEYTGEPYLKTTFITI